jgi:DNA-binding NtrC family response regulator
VLQDGELTRLGSNRPVVVDVRVIAATNRDLPAMIRAGTFREDLYYRLQVIEIVVPPLRERLEEIHPLTDYFLDKYARVYRRRPIRTTTALRTALTRYAWPGNVRELENMMQRFVVLQDETFILGELARQSGRAGGPLALHLPLALDEGSAVAGVETDAVVHATLQEVARAAAKAAERDAIAQALERFRWNRRKAAAFLNISYKTMLNKMKEFDVGAFDIDATVK